MIAHAPGGHKAAMSHRSASKDELAGQCPGCYGFGAVGDPCASAGCVARGLHFVPAAEVYAADVALDPLIGRKIDSYLVVGVVGSGGFGRVYRAMELPIGMRVALKVANLEGASASETATLLDRFEQEAAALAALNHPNIVRLLRYGTLGQRPYLVMELVPGDRTLAQVLTEVLDGRRALTRRDVANVLFPLIEALGAAHAHGFVHRDVKPENIMLQPMPSGPPLLRLLDFGLARPVTARSRASRPMGTPLYMAPEQLSNGAVGAWTDLYAVGVIAYELFFGVAPYTGDSQQVFRQKLDRRFDPLAGLTAAPEEVRSFLARALAADPEARFRSADEMRPALASALGAWEGAVEIEVPQREATPKRKSGGPTREARPPLASPAAAANDDDLRLLAAESDWFEPVGADAGEAVDV
ncbi:MAG: serine/threonine protein kinase, partial [Deltaproteobacteria bacterium]